MDNNPQDVRLQELMKIVESDEPRFLNYPIRGFAVGRELCILSLAHEAFAEYQLFAVDKSPFKHTMVFSYTFGVESYICTKRDYDMGLRGGYEASPRGFALSSKHRLALEPEVEKMIQDGIVQVFRELSGDSKVRE